MDIFKSIEEAVVKRDIEGVKGLTQNSPGRHLNHRDSGDFTHERNCPAGPRVNLNTINFIIGQDKLDVD